MTRTPSRFRDRRLWWVGLVLLWAWLGSGVAPAAAQTSTIPGLRPLFPPAAPPPAPPSTATPARVNGDAPEPESPRRAVVRFLTQSHTGRFAEAARDLDLTPAQAAQGATLARHLQAVLDLRLPLDLDRISDAAAGDLRDGLPADQEEIGRIPNPLGGAVSAGAPGAGSITREAVRLRRLGSEDGGRWVFTQRTVARIESWYERLPDRWLRDHLPEPLLRVGPQGLTFWQWLSLPLLLLGTYLLSVVLVFLLTGLLLPIVRRTRAAWDDLLLRELRAPARLSAVALLGEVWQPYLYLSSQAVRFTQGLLRLCLWAAVLLALWRAIDVLARVVSDSAWLRARPAALAVVPLGRRLTEVTVLAIATVTALQSLGVEVTSLLAGLGIGGLAVALAAQKTVEHLFGGVMLSVDQPLRVGDLVKIGDLLGTVEEIGLRSTRLRTQERTLITIPNGKLAELNIETYGARDRIRLYQLLHLALTTDAKAVRALLADLEALLHQHPRIYRDPPPSAPGVAAEPARPGEGEGDPAAPAEGSSVTAHSPAIVVRLNGITDSALLVELSCWFLTRDFAEFQLLRHEVLLQVLERMDAHHVAPGYPARTLRLQAAP